MDRAGYGKAYQEGFDSTVHFLVSRGVPADKATEFAQLAWTRGWERRDQLRDESIILRWINTIALNQLRLSRREERRLNRSMAEGGMESPDIPR